MSFDRLAPHYRRLEDVLAGRVLQRARMAFLPALDQAGHVLLAGEGPGRMLGALHGRPTSGLVTVVDASIAMLREAARVVPPASRDRVRFVHADLRTWRPPAGAFDGIVTSCVLDCFAPATVAAVVERLAASARGRADWLHIDFALPAAGWRRWRARGLHAAMYAVFRATTGIEARRVTPPDRWLESAGFARLAVREFSAGLVRSEHWQRGRDNSGVAPAPSGAGGFER